MTTPETVQGWNDELLALHARIGPRFARSEPRTRALAYMRGLLSTLERKNGWQLAEHAGDATPDGIQRLLSTTTWDENLVRDDLREYALEHLGNKQGVLVVDETGFLKKGSKSVGVKHQYTGTAGRVENAQVGVFLAYSTGLGTAFIDRELFLPEDWVDDQERRGEARVPDDVRFKAKPQLALEMLKRAFGAGIKPDWVAADSVYASSELRRFLEDRKQPFVLGVTAQFLLRFPQDEGIRQARADELSAELKPRAWKRLSAGSGTKGERVFDWAWVRLRDLGHRHGPVPPQARRGFDKWLLARRSPGDPGSTKHYIVFARADVTLEAVAIAAGSRWVIETGFEAAKNEAGLDEYEVRSWTGWYRHVTLSMLAHAFLAAVRASALQKGGRLEGRRG